MPTGAATGTAEPDVVKRILDHGYDDVTTKPFVVGIGFKRLAIVSGGAHGCSKPEVTFAVAKYGIDGIAAQAFIRAKIHKVCSIETTDTIFVGGKPKINAYNSLKEIPAKTPEAEAMSKDLKARGFRFVGPTICYAFMQAAGMVNDHVTSCFRYDQVQEPQS